MNKTKKQRLTNRAPPSQRKKQRLTNRARPQGQKEKRGQQIDLKFEIDLKDDFMKTHEKRSCKKVATSHLADILRKMETTTRN